MAFWPALLLARERRLPWALRGVLAGSAVLLAEVALLSQSRGSLYATPDDRGARVRAAAGPHADVRAAPGRWPPASPRPPPPCFASEIICAPAKSCPRACTPRARRDAAGRARRGAPRRRRRGAGGAPRRACTRSARASCTASRPRPRSSRSWRSSRADSPLPGNPVTRAEKAWHSFKGGYGIGGGNRLLSGLGSNRYDFFRVALDEFRAHPVGGIGADNFQQQYLRHGHSNETPRYPHSVELRTLSQTGVIGTLLALLGLGAALLAAMRAARSPDRLARGRRRGRARRLRLLGDPRLGRLVLGVRGARCARVRHARAVLRAGPAGRAARPGAGSRRRAGRGSAGRPRRAPRDRRVAEPLAAVR